MSSTFPPYSGSKGYSSVASIPSTRECKQDFSVTMSHKSKNWKRLNSSSYDFRCAVSTKVPCSLHKSACGKGNRYNHHFNK